MENFIAHLKEVIPEKDSLKLVKKEAENYYKQHSLDECFATGLELYQSENFQIQEVGVFLVGYAACKNTSALSFLKDTVSQHKSCTFYIYGYDHDTGSDRTFEHSFPSGNGYRAVPVYFKDREAGMLAC